MKINWKNLSSLTLTLLLIFLFLMFFGFRFTGVGTEIKIIKNDRLVSPSATAEFSFVPNLDNLEGLVLYFDKFYYLEGEKDGNLKFSIEYLNNNDKLETRSQAIPVKTLVKGDRKVLFSPLKKSRGQEVIVRIIADENTKILSDPGIILYLTDKNIDSEIDIAPRPIYHFQAREILAKIYNRFLGDKKFTALYISLMSITFLGIVILATFDYESKRQN